MNLRTLSERLQMLEKMRGKAVKKLTAREIEEEAQNRVKLYLRYGPVFWGEDFDPSPEACRAIYEQELIDIQEEIADPEGSLLKLLRQVHDQRLEENLRGEV